MPCQINFSEIDPRIILVHQINGGVSVARNTGIAKATGEYITFVDSDDWLEKEMYVKLIAQIEKRPDLDMGMCDATLIKNNAKMKSSGFIKSGYYSKSQIISELYPTLLVTENFGKIPIVSVWNCLIKRSILIENNIRFEPSLKYSEDYLFMAKLMINVNSFFYCKGEYNYNYRQYPESRSKLLQKDWWPSLVNLNKKLKELLAESVEYDFSRQLKLQLIQSALFLSSAVLKNNLLTTKEKIVWLQKLFTDSDLQAAFKNLRFNKQSWQFRIVLCLMKYKKYSLFIAYRSLVNKIKA
jgi:glycosyltransferase involved in cell wall biosynthesis